jgi:phage baseplate assembly protein W
MATANSQIFFTGFSTIGSTLTKNWTYYDIDLVKIDLLNAFNTRVGERVMRPSYGCKIWDYLMEPLTPSIVDLISQEATSICEADSRVNVNSVNVYQFGQGIRVELTLIFNPFGVIDTFTVDFESRQDSELGFT